MSKASKIFLAIIVFLIIVIIVGSGFLIGGNKVFSNIYVEGIDVSRLTKTEASQKLENHLGTRLEDLKLQLNFKDKSWTLPLKDIDYKYDIQKAIEDAYSVGRKSNYFKRVFDVIGTSCNRHEFEATFSYNEDKLKEYIENLSKDIDQEKIDATITFKKPNFILTDDSEGRKLDQSTAFTLISEEILKKMPSAVELPVETIEAGIKRSDLEQIKDVLGEFSTTFNSADVDRTHNIRVATTSAANVLLFPGEIYSVNQVVGPRLEKFGFKEAKVIINNELVPGIGGGVCQVSTTLYNAALLSNLSIVERRNHTLPSSYVPLGRDATISGDYIDFKFMNSTPYPIYIYGEVAGNWVKFSIYGRNDNKDRKVSIQTETVSVTEPTMEIVEDPTLAQGTEIVEKKAQKGYVVKSYRVIKENGKVISKELLFTDRYKVVNGLKRVGTLNTNVNNGDGLNQNENNTGESALITDTVQ